MDGFLVLLTASIHSPARIIGGVGAVAPPSSSTVTPKAFASTPFGSEGMITLALPCSSGRNAPAGIGLLPAAAGISHNSYVLPGCSGSRLLAVKISAPLLATYVALPCGNGAVLPFLSVPRIA